MSCNFLRWDFLELSCDFVLIAGTIRKFLTTLEGSTQHNTHYMSIVPCCLYDYSNHFALCTRVFTEFTSYRVAVSDSGRVSLFPLALDTSVGGG